MPEPTLEGLALRLAWLETDRLARLETNAAMKSDLDRERESRLAADLRLEDAIKGMVEDIAAIRSSITWALRTVAASLFVGGVSFLVYVASHR